MHDRALNWLAPLIERHLLGKLGRLDSAEREQPVAQTLDGAAHDLVARQRSVDAPFAADEVEIFCQRALTQLSSLSRYPVTLHCFRRRTQAVGHERQSISPEPDVRLTTPMVNGCWVEKRSAL
jgi:hypothetical protein